MASLYILGNSDHYTSHSFVLFYWENFVRTVLGDWNDELADSLEESVDDDKVVLNKQQDELVGISKVDDYIYWPCECTNMCLYDWVRLSNKSKRQHRRTEYGHDNSDNEQFDNKDWCIDTQEPKSFTSEHPQYNSHQVVIEDESEFHVPTFLGRPVPREDKGDRKYYACTMLTLFKPWWMGKDLKSNDDTWNDAFVSHSFGPRDRKIMKYFGVKYK